MKYSRPYKHKCKWWQNRHEYSEPENKNKRVYTYETYIQALRDFSTKWFEIKYETHKHIAVEDKHL